ncbi:hypothetical protein KHQ81_00935 [Mycoplasmatota bacterium]|nr:hypothetical protein KHQ81_00935 [Mycoplasmatota bacterium]
MRSKIFSLLAILFLVSTLSGCKGVEQKKEEKLDELTSETTTEDITSSETSTKEEEPIDLGFEVVNSDFNMDWNSSRYASMLFELTPEYYLASFYDSNNQNWVLNSLDETGNLLDTSNVNYLSIIKNYGEKGLLYLMRENDEYKTKKVNKDGEVWEKEGYFRQSDVHFSTQDGGYITKLVQYDNKTNKSNAYLIKLNSEGNFVWELGPYNQVRMIKEYEDGSFLFQYSNKDLITHLVRYNAELEQVMDIEILELLENKKLKLTENYIFVHVVINNKQRIQCYDLDGNLQSEYTNSNQFSLLTYDDNFVYFLEHELKYDPKPYMVSTINRLDNLGNKETLPKSYDKLKIMKHYQDGSILLSYEDPDLNYLKLTSDGQVVYDKKMVNEVDNSNFFFITQLIPKDQGVMYHYQKSVGSLIGKLDANGDKEWEIQAQLDSYYLMDGINDDIYIFYDEPESNIEFAHHNSQGELINSITLNGNIESIQNFKVLENGNIVYTLLGLDKEYLVILSPSGQTLYNQELKGYIYNNFGDHKTFFTINDKGEQEQVTLKYDAIGFISFQSNYYY